MSRAGRRMLLLLWVFLPALGSAAQEVPAPTARALRVLVLDTAGHPVAGATLRAIPLEVHPGDTEIRPQTAADGSAQIPLGADGTSSWLLVEKGGYTPTLRSLSATVPKQGELRIVLEPGSLAVGRVVDAAGRPVAGVEVELTGVPPGLHSIEASFLREALRYRVRTGPAGRFRLRDLPVASFEAMLRHPEHAPLKVAYPLPGGISGLLGTFVLQRGTTLRGTVTDPAGRPLAGARVWARSDQEPCPDTLPEPSTFTGIDGSFAVANLPDGAGLDLWICAAGFLEAQESLPSFDQPVRIVLRPAGAVRGRVLGPHGEPLAGATVQLREQPLDDVEQAPLCSSGKLAMTDGEGRFVLEGIRPAWIELLAKTPGLVDGRSGRLLARAGEPLKDIEIRLRSGIDIAGRVLDPDGSPIAGAWVQAWSKDYNGRALIKADGSFHLSGFAPGRVVLEAAAKHHRSESRELSLGPTGWRADFVLERSGEVEAEVSGRVLTPDGFSVEGALVTTDGTRVSSAWDGSFTARFQKGSSSREGKLTAEKPGFALGRSVVRLEGTRVDGVEIRLEAGTQVHGKVFGLTADELRLATVTAGEYPHLWSTRIDASGHFQLGPLPSGTWNLVATAGDRTTWVQLLAEPRQPEVTAELTFAPVYEVSGRVLDPEGRPAAGAHLAVVNQTTPIADTYTRQDGSFQLAAPAGDFALQITAEPWRQKQPLRITDAPGTDLEIRLEPGTTLHGRVLGSTQDEEEATLRIYLDGPSTWRPAEVLPGGTWRGRGLTPGPWTVHAVRSLRQGNQMLDRQIQIPQGLAELTLDLDFTGVPVLDGTGEEEP